MPKTLADMTPQERAQCRGMWCDFPDPDERTNLAIYVDDSLKHQGFCELIHEGEIGTLTLPHNLTPRPDLPRAWAPNGTPPAGKWEYTKFLSHYQGMSHSNATVTWALTYGETTPYVWCVYVNGIPEKRFIRREEAIHYLDKSVRGHSIND